MPVTFTPERRSKLLKQAANSNTSQYRIRKEYCMEPIFVVFIIFGSTALVIYKYLETRHKERMAMIEKGVSPADFKGMSLRDFLKTNPLSSLKWGLVLMFVGIGLMVATFLDQAYYMSDSVYPGSMLIFGGLAFVIFYSIASRKMKQE